MSRIGRFIPLVAVLALGVAAAFTGAAGTVADDIPPTVKIDRKFDVGQQVEPAVLDPEAFCWSTTAPMKVFWRGSDTDSGIASYDLYWTLEPPNLYQQVLSDTTERSYATAADDWDCTTGANPGYFWKVVAQDRAGNTAEAVGAGYDIQVNQEDGSDVGGGWNLLGVTMADDWQPDQCTCSDGGATLYSTQAGATITYTNDGGWDKWVAIVMAKDVDRGEVSIQVGRRHPDIVDTYATAPGDATIVWQHEFKKKRTQAITITNLGTDGRSRVDVDSILQTPGLESMS